MWKDGELSWLLAAASFDNEEQELGKALENEGVHMGKKLTTNTAVPQRLCRDKSYAEFYRDVLEADEKIVKMVANGYKVPFDENPLEVFAEDNKSCLRNTSFAIQELKRLEKLQCVKQVLREDCKVIMPLSIVYSNKLRLVVDASRHINPYITKKKVKLDLLKEFAFLVENKEFVAVDSLDSGY